MQSFFSIRCIVFLSDFCNLFAEEESNNYSCMMIMDSTLFVLFDVLRCKRDRLIDEMQDFSIFINLVRCLGTGDTHHHPRLKNAWRGVFRGKVSAVINRE